MERSHYPVLHREISSFLALGEKPGLIVDSTLGEGGHSALLLENSSAARLIGVDTDPDMLKRAKVFLGPLAERAQFVNSWFDRFWTEYAGPRPDRILFDVGISSFHIGLSGRGFTFRADEPLDMRLSPHGRSAAELIAVLSEPELADIIYAFGEERYSRRIARAICVARNAERLKSTRELAEIVFEAVPVGYRHGRIHPATRTFQAIRIAVNGELEQLSVGLAAAIQALSPDEGRLAVISFHSLEDRIVKWMFRTAARFRSTRPRDGSGSQDSILERIAPTIKNAVTLPEGERVSILTKKPVVPGAEEVRENPASRSAKLRVIEKSLSKESE